MREVSFGQDGVYSHEAIVNRINADLANDLGNLAQRSLSMIGKLLRAACAAAGRLLARGQTLLAAADALLERCRAEMDQQAIHLALTAIWQVVADANRYFAAQEPWALRKTDPERMATVLYVTAEVVRQIAILVQPVMPASAARMLDLAGGPGRGAELREPRRGGAACAGHGAAAGRAGLSALRREGSRRRGTVAGRRLRRPAEYRDARSSRSAMSPSGSGREKRKPCSSVQPVEARNCALLLRLDALGRDHQPERLADIGDGLDDRAGIRRLPEILHERSVDLHLVDLQPAQVREARIAGAEIVERDPHAGRAQIPQAAGDDRRRH